MFITNFKSFLSMKLPGTLLTNVVVDYQMLLKWILLFLAGIHCFTEFVIYISMDSLAMYLYNRNRMHDMLPKID